MSAPQSPTYDNPGDWIMADSQYNIYEDDLVRARHDEIAFDADKDYQPPKEEMDMASWALVHDPVQQNLLDALPEYRKYIRQRINSDSFRPIRPAALNAPNERDIEVLASLLPSDRTTSAPPALLPLQTPSAAAPLSPTSDTDAEEEDAYLPFENSASTPGSPTPPDLTLFPERLIDLIGVYDFIHLPVCDKKISDLKAEDLTAPLMLLITPQISGFIAQTEALYRLREEWYEVNLDKLLKNNNHLTQLERRAASSRRGERRNTLHQQIDTFSEVKDLLKPTPITLAAVEERLKKYLRGFI